MEHRIASLYYYIDSKDTQCGPVIKDQLVVLGVNPNTFVWREGMTDWQQAKFVEELNSVWNNGYFNSSCRICKLDGSATCRECKDESLFSLSNNISPNWLMRQTKKMSSLQEQKYVPVSATGWLIAAYIFAILGGLLGIAFGISIWNQKVESNGRKVYKYKKTHRQLGILAAIIAIISVFVWKFVTI